MRTFEKCPHLFAFCPALIFEICVFWNSMQQNNTNQTEKVKVVRSKQTKPIPALEFNGFEPFLPGYT